MTLGKVPPRPPPPPPLRRDGILCETPISKKVPPPPPSIPNEAEEEERMRMSVDNNDQEEEEEFGKENRGAPVETPPASGNLPPHFHNIRMAGTNTSRASLLSSSSLSYRQKVSRFQFVSDTKAVKDLSLLEEETFRRRNKLREQSNDLYRRLAHLTTLLAQEQMDRQAEQSMLVETCIFEPLERVSERFLHRLMDQDFLETTLQPLEQKVSHMDSSLLHHLHVQTHHNRFAQLESLRSSIRHQMQPLLTLESTKADKREGGLVRKLESMAGMSARSFADESSQRYASLSLLDQKINAATTQQKKRQDEFLQHIRQLRIQLQTERRKRVQADEQVLQQIIDTKQHFQRIALESLGST